MSWIATAQCTGCTATLAKPMSVRFSGRKGLQSRINIDFAASSPHPVRRGLVTRANIGFAMDERQKAAEHTHRTRCGLSSETTPKTGNWKAAK